MKTYAVALSFYCSPKYCSSTTYVGTSRTLYLYCTISSTIIYTPDITVFKSDTDFPEILPESEWYKVDVLTCAAPNLRDHDIYDPTIGAWPHYLFFLSITLAEQIPKSKSRKKWRNCIKRFCPSWSCVIIELYHSHRIYAFFFFFFIEFSRFNTPFRCGKF